MVFKSHAIMDGPQNALLSPQNRREGGYYVRLYLKIGAPTPRVAFIKMVFAQVSNSVHYFGHA